MILNLTFLKSLINTSLFNRSEKILLLTAEQKQELNQIILEGVVKRARILSLIYSFTFTLYGFTSLEFIQLYRPQTTLLENILPRFIFNSIPFLFMAWYFRNPNHNITAKSWTWAICFPIIYFAATLVWVSPLLYQGHSEICLFFHPADTFAFPLTLLFISAPPHQMLTTFFGLFILDYIPTFSMLYRNGNKLVLDLFVNDMSFFTIFFLLGAYLAYRLRYVIARNELLHRAQLNSLISSQAHQIEIKTQEALDLQIPAALGEIASQVSHDIQSPLVALKVVSNSISSISEDEKAIMQMSINRIQEITQSLLKKHRSQIKEHFRLIPCIEEVILEKKIQFQQNQSIQIQSESDLQTDTFVQLDQIEFKRVISNLLNNAIEAISGNGIIRVTSTQLNDCIVLAIQDNGMGMSPDVLSKIGQRGMTFGKKEGSGLGLFHAKSQIEKWGCTLEITSALGQGTTVRLILPKNPKDSKVRVK